MPDKLILRLTQKVFDKEKTRRPPAEEFATGLLNEWFVDLVPLTGRRKKAYLFVHGSSYLAIIVNEKNLKLAVPVFLDRLEKLLARTGIKVSPDLLPSGASPILTRTNSRRALGVVNDFKFILDLQIQMDYEVAEEIDFDKIEDLLSKTVLFASTKEPVWPFKKIKSLFEGGSQVNAAASTERVLISGLRLKVKLNYLEPEIFRIFQVSASTTFYELHHVLQVLMAWENRHLFEFKVQRSIISLPEFDAGPEGPAQAYAARNARRVQVSEVLKEPMDSVTYIYDLGDDWEHEITMEGFVDAPAEKFPLCLEGQGGPLPEDCGGVPGYQNLLEVLSDPKNPNYRTLKQWVGKGYPFRFDQQKINSRLRALPSIIKLYEEN